MINTLPELILSKVCEYYNVDKSKVKGLSRKKELAKARHIYSFLSVSMTHVTREKIGELINRDHSLITYAYAKIGGMTDIYSDINIEVKHIKWLIERVNCEMEVKSVDLLAQSEMNTKFLNSWAI